VDLPPIVASDAGPASQADPSIRHPALVPLQVADRKPLTLFGAPAEAVLLPARAYRSDRPSPQRPPFGPCRAEAILRDETLWTSNDGQLAATPNKFPFVRDQLILWPTQPMRDPSLPLWTVAHQWVHAQQGVGMLNNIGAAASIPRAHVHLGNERGGFLPALKTKPSPFALDLPLGVTAEVADLPFCLLVLRGSPEARAEAVWRLAEQRFTPTWNVVVDPEGTWVMPRSREHGGGGGAVFAAAVGAAEVWGRWCFASAEAWQKAAPGLARPELLEAELGAVGVRVG
jgi:hypothetical protein